MKNHTEPEAVAIREKWLAREKEFHEWRYAELNRGLDMLKENFPALWD